MTLALAHPASQPLPDRERLAVLVAELPPLQRRVVEGYFLEHGDVAALAGETGLTIDDLRAVRTLALRALRDGFLPVA